MNRSAKADVFLIGFMGSGKTRIGRELARRLALPFADCDPAVEKAAGKSIRRLFLEDGEERFRELEAVALRRLGQGRGTVVATGGGAVTRRENIALMRRQGRVVYLQVPFETAARRVGSGGAKARPLWARAKKLFRERLPVYRRAAHLIVRAGLGKPDEIAARIQRRLEEDG